LPQKHLSSFKDWNIHTAGAGPTPCAATAPGSPAAVAASALARLRQQGGPVAAVELLMTTPNGERAGQFVLTSELADDLLQGRVDVATFFLAHVQF
jgi:hypothetical protein